MDVKQARVAGRVMVACIALACLGSCVRGEPANPGLDGDSTWVEGGAVGCPDAGDPGCPTPAPSWDAQVKKIADAWCATCHFPGSPSGLDFSSVAGFHHDVGTARSDVLSCVMPPNGQALSPAQWETLLEWLACGTPDN